MTLSITGSPVLIGNDDIGHIEFLPTDMDAVDASGNPTGKKLLIARTPHTNESRNRINGHLLDQDKTYGSMVMHGDGTAYVVGRFARLSNPNPQQTQRNPVMEAGHGAGTVISVINIVPFYPDSSLIMAIPDFATHPAVNMTWYESASQAAVIEDAHRAATGQEIRVRMMRNREYIRFITWDGKYTAEQVIARAHLNRDGITGTASVSDAAAALRTTEEGFVDPLGNVWIWTDDVKERPATGADMDKITRISRGAAYNSDPQDALADFCLDDYPWDYNELSGVRFVAVLRS